MAQYINKADLAAKIEERYNECLRKSEIFNETYWNGKANGCRDMLIILDNIEAKELDLEKKIDAIEVKDADLEKELSYDDYIGFFKEHPNFPDDWGYDEARVFANYFFKLGLKQTINPELKELMEQVCKYCENQAIYDKLSDYKNFYHRFKRLLKQ